MLVLGSLREFIWVSAARVGAAGDVVGHATQISTAITAVLRGGQPYEGNMFYSVS